MSEYNTQICHKENDYRIQFQTSDYEEFKEVEWAVQKIKDKYEAKLAAEESELNQISLFDIVDRHQDPAKY